MKGTIKCNNDDCNNTNTNDDGNSGGGDYTEKGCLLFLLNVITITLS